MQQVINWRKLSLAKSDFLSIDTQGTPYWHVRVYLRALVRGILSQYPWNGRQDLVALFSPQLSYAVDQEVAFPVLDPQNLRPAAWEVSKVTKVAVGENPLQKKFQVVTFQFEDRMLRLAADLDAETLMTISIPVDDTEEMELLAGYFIEHEYDSLLAALGRAIETKIVHARLNGEYVILGGIENLGDIEKLFLDELIQKRSTTSKWLNSTHILSDLRDMGGFDHVPDEIALDIIEEYLVSANYVSLGFHNWITVEKKQEFDRFVEKRSRVPVVRSKLFDIWNIEDEESAEFYSEIPIGEEAGQTLAEFGEGEDIELEGQEEWQPPSSPIQMPTLTYQNILEGFFSLSKKVEKAFPFHDGQQLVEICLVDSEEKSRVPFLVDREENILKAIDRDTVRNIFIERNLPAGTKLWIKYLHDHVYRIYPEPLNPPDRRKCKIAMWDGETGTLSFDIADVEVAYEHESQVFVAELRHLDVEALFKEAEQVGESIFDALVYAFEELGALNKDGKVHHTDLFNAVFFKHRMCSPRTVVTELYSRPCFVSVGDGYFVFDKSKGFRRITHVKKTRGVVFDVSLKSLLSGLLGKELSTLDKDKRFWILSVADNHIDIRTSLIEGRRINAIEIQNSWDYLIQAKSLTRGFIQDNFSPYNPAYIAAILAHFPNVEFTNDPITLYYKIHQVENIWEKYVFSVNPSRYIGWTVVHQRKLKGYEDLWAKYFKFLLSNPDADEGQTKAATGIHWRGTMHPRYLGFVTENKEITQAGKYFVDHPAERQKILDSQLQKWYYCVDLFCDPDPEYDVFPLFSILKILLSLPESFYAVSMDEVKFFILPTKNHFECEDRVQLIREYRKNPKVWNSQITPLFRKTYIDRIGHLLELSPMLYVSEAEVRINQAEVKNAAAILASYQELENQGKIPHYKYKPQKYLAMLRSELDIFSYCK